MKRAFVLAAIWATLTAGTLAINACYSENCAGQVITYGDKPGEGHMIDENTWESSPEVGDWLFYGSSRFYFFRVPAWGDRVPLLVLPYVSPVQDPNVFHPERPPSNYTLAGGNLAEISGADRNAVNVRNGTCANYYLRVVVTLQPRPPVTDIDSGTDAEADAQADAQSDAAGGVDAGSDAGDAGDGEAGP